MKNTTRFVLSGAVFVVIGMAAWAALLSGDTLRFFLVVSSVPKHHPAARSMISDIVEQSYPLMFVIAAWIVAQRKWSTRCIYAYPITYTILVGIWGGVFCRHMPRPIQPLELFTLLSPIPLSLLTAILVKIREARTRTGVNHTPDGIRRPADGSLKPSM